MTAECLAPLVLLEDFEVKTTGFEIGDEVVVDLYGEVGVSSAFPTGWKHLESNGTGVVMSKDSIAGSISEDCVYVMPDEPIPSWSEHPSRHPVLYSGAPFDYPVSKDETVRLQYVITGFEQA